MAKKTATTTRRVAPARQREGSANVSAPGPAPTAEEIAEAAYLRYLSRGARHGQDFDDWVEAERELRERRARKSQ